MNPDDFVLALRQLDQSLITGQPTELTRYWVDEINSRWSLVTRTEKKPSTAERVAGDLGLDFVAQIIRDKGLRFRALEQAIGCDKIVVTGSVNLKHNVLKALRGEESLKVSVDKAHIRLEIWF